MKITILTLCRHEDGTIRAIETPEIGGDGVVRTSYTSPPLRGHATAEAVEAVARECVAKTSPSFDGGDMNFRLREAGLI